MPKPMIDNAVFLKALPKWKDGDLEHFPQFSVAGRSNVGKSSLINSLANRKGLAKTSGTPGKTQSLVIFRADYRDETGTQPFHLVDLPGYGYAKVSKDLRATWRPMMESYFTGNQRIAVCLLLMDIRREPNDDDMELAEMMNETGHLVLPVITKADKIPKTQRVKALKPIAAALGVEDWRDLWIVSAFTGEGMGELLVEIGRLLREKAASVTPPALEEPQS